MRKTYKQKGITLVALVITIIILLILAGITISSLTNTGLFEKAKEAKEKTQNAEKNQQSILDEYEKTLNESTAETLVSELYNKVLSFDNNTTLKDVNGNTFVVPAGFKIVVNDDTNNAITVDKGIVVEDETETATKGNQFVWVPVGKIKKVDGSITTITLGRYEFDSSTGAEKTYSGGFVEEDSNDISTVQNKGNTIAKNITKFKMSVAKNGGYFIGRYEARTIKTRTSNEEDLTQITEKVTDQVYNYVTQLQAANLSQKMYNNEKIISDLMNSYAWDTTITFIQKCTNQVNYAYQTSLNTSSLALNGTTEDKQCNIFDMASNVREFTTETSNYSDGPCNIRGGVYNINNRYTCVRISFNTTLYDVNVGFRPILYL